MQQVPTGERAMGTALAHMLRGDATAGQPDTGTAGPAVARSLTWSPEDQAGPLPVQSTGDATPFADGPPPWNSAIPRPGHHPGTETRAPGPAEIDQARLIASKLAAAGKPISRRALRNGGIRGSNEALNALARMIKAETTDRSS